MEPFTRLAGIAAALPLDNVDTDMIWPAGPHISLRRGEQQRNAFARLRFQEGSGEEEPGFVLNREPWRNARILVTGRNFGCGSSREMAVWSLYEWGLRCIIAPSFGDIFAANAALNGLLPVELPEAVVAGLMERAADPARCVMEIDLVGCRVRAEGIDIGFTVDSHRRGCLLAGLDETGFTLALMPVVAAFGENYLTEYPWTVPVAEEG